MVSRAGEKRGWEGMQGGGCISHNGGTGGLTEEVTLGRDWVRRGTVGTGDEQGQRPGASVCLACVRTGGPRAPQQSRGRRGRRQSATCRGPAGPRGGQDGKPLPASQSSSVGVHTHLRGTLGCCADRSF